MIQAQTPITIEEKEKRVPYLSGCAQYSHTKAATLTIIIKRKNHSKIETKPN